MRIAESIVAAAVLLLSTKASGQILAGRILEVESNRAIGAAVVTVTSDGQAIRSAESDSSGAFRLVIGHPGTYSLRVDRLAYAQLASEAFSIGAGETLEVLIHLSVRAISLAPLAVVDRRRTPAAAPEFQRRLEEGRRSGLGAFVTRATLDSTSHTSVTSVLTFVPLVGMTYDGRLGKATPVVLSQGGCSPALYLNGAPLQLGRDEYVDDVLDPAWLEGIEIYRNRNELPSEFAGAGARCAIAFWTREPQTDRGGLWRYVAGGAAVVGLLILFFAN